MFTISDVENAEPAFDSEGESEDDENAALFPVRCSINITKPTGGALAIEALAQDGIFTIETVSYYKDAKLATDMSADADYKRRGTYVGPQFEHLDVNLQEGFEAFLAERGIDESFALLIPDYAEWKEQKVSNRLLFVCIGIDSSYRNMLTGSTVSRALLPLRPQHLYPFLLSLSTPEQNSTRFKALISRITMCH